MPSGLLGAKGKWGVRRGRGPFVVTAKLPERDGQFEYHIKHPSEPHERAAKENELRGEV